MSLNLTELRKKWNQEVERYDAEENIRWNQCAPNKDNPDYASAVWDYHHARMKILSVKGLGYAIEASQ